VWNVGGQQKVLALWGYHFQGTQGLIFIVEELWTATPPESGPRDLRGAAQFEGRNTKRCVARVCTQAGTVLLTRESFSRRLEIENWRARVARKLYQTKASAGVGGLCSR
jgi:hypothetical protein